MSRLAVTLPAILLLSACGGDIRQAIGLDRNPPDEFQVVTRAPLSVPPSYDLRPPRPGAPRPQELSTRDQARSALVGKNQAGLSENAPAASAGETFLLQNSNAAASDPNIRTLLDQENAARQQARTQPIDALLPAKQNAADPIVDADTEAARIRAAQAQKQPVDTAKTATLEPPEQNLWQRLKDLF